MFGDDDKYAIGLMMDTPERNKYPGDDTLGFRFHLVKVMDEDDSIRSFSSTSYSPEAYADLDISGVMSPASNDVYGWRVEYRDVFSVNRERAALMAKTLGRIERGLEKLDKDFGYPETFFTYVARVAKIVGVKKFVFRTDHHSTFRIASDPSSMVYAGRLAIDNYKKEMGVTVNG